MHAAVPHGFRSSVRDWAAEETDHPREVAETALAHKVRSRLEPARQGSRPEDRVRSDDPPRSQRRSMAFPVGAARAALTALLAEA